jgi:histidine kinase-like protein
VLAEWGLGGLADTAELVVSELVANAVRHARTPPGREIETRYELLPGGAVRIEVHDAGDAWPQVQQPGPEAESGRGLALADAVTGGRWGVAPRVGVGKYVWALVAAEDGGDGTDGGDG